MDQTTPIQWIVTALEEDRRNADRVLVTITPVEWADSPGISPAARSLALHIAVVSSYGLRLGLVLGNLELAALNQADAFQKIVNRALDFLAVRPRSAWEVRQRLRRKQVEEEDIVRVLERLERAGYLDDPAFARYWIGERARSSPRGPRLIAQELRRKGVSSDIIKQALDDFQVARQEEYTMSQLNDADNPDQDEAEGDPEYDEVLRLAQRKHRAYASLDTSTYRRRMSAFLQRRGYSYALISRALKALQDEPPE